MDSFNSYHEWLGIPPDEQPPNNYRLLGIPDFEPNDKVISNSADRQMLFVRQFQVGEHLGESQKLLNEIAAAKVCLLNATAKANYDAVLRQVSSPILVQAIPSDRLSNSVMPVVADYAPSHTENKPSMRTNSAPRQSAIRLTGQILAPIVGVTLGWLIIWWIRGDRSLPAVTSQSVDVSEEKDIFQANSDHKTAPSTPSQVEPRKDLAKSMTPTTPTQDTAESTTPNSPQVALPPAEPSVEQTESIRTKAVSEGDIAAALMATHKLSLLEGQDSIQARFTMLQELNAKEGIVPQQIVDAALLLLDEAIASDHESAKDIATFGLVSARHINDLTLIRKATLGVLKTQNSDSPSIGDQQ